MNPRVICLIVISAIAANFPPDARANTTNITSSADTSLFELDPNNNLGGELYTIAGRIGTGERSRALYKFDLANVLPTNATISSVSLKLAVGSANGVGKSFSLHRVLKSWGEGVGSGGGGGSGTHGSLANSGEATWLARYYPSTTWDAPGGQSGSDFVATASASTLLGASSITFTDVNLIADLERWRTNAGTNFGWMVKIANETTLHTASHLGAREDSVNAPVLTIQYSVPVSTPANPPNIFDTALDGTALRFSFNAQSNLTYAVEYRDAVSSGPWNPLTNLPASVADSIVSLTNPISSAERYFRVKTP